MEKTNREMLVLRLRLQAAILTLIVGFSVPAVRILEWLRLPGDIVFIAGGILPVVYLAVRMFLRRNRSELPAGAAVDEFTERRR